MRLVRPIFRLVFILAWIIKGALLAIALAALALWPWSYWDGRNITLSRTRQLLELEEGEYYDLGWKDGRIGIGETRIELSGELLALDLNRKPGTDSGWQRKFELTTLLSMDVLPGSSLGPLKWASNEKKDRYFYQSERSASVSCWLLALFTAAWPLTSLTLAYRRRSRRRLARAGCCAKCGYDLRATPEMGGELLERCPECGAVSKAADPGPR